MHVTKSKGHFKFLYFHVTTINILVTVGGSVLALTISASCYYFVNMLQYMAKGTLQVSLKLLAT